MGKEISRTPSVGAPEGTVWFGGPVDRWKVTLRVYGGELDPDKVSARLGCQPTSAARRGNPHPRKGRWRLKIDSRECDPNDDVEDGIKMLLTRLPSEKSLWDSLTTDLEADVYCALFLRTSNRGFGISAEVLRLLSDRNLEIGFDIYFGPDKDLGDGGPRSVGAG